MHPFASCLAFRASALEAPVRRAYVIALYKWTFTLHFNLHLEKLYKSGTIQLMFWLPRRTRDATRSSAVAETARRFVSLNILLSLKVIQNDTLK